MLRIHVAFIVNTLSLLKDKIDGGPLYITFIEKSDELSMTIPYLQYDQSYPYKCNDKSDGCNQHSCLKFNVHDLSGLL